MKIERAIITPYRLPLERPLVTGRQTLTAREGLLLELRSRSGLRGWGDACPIAGFRMESLAEARRSLETLSRRLLGREFAALDPLLDECESEAGSAPAARFAVDAALHGLCAGAAGKSLAEFLGERGNRVPGTCVEVSALVSDGAALASHCDEAPAAARLEEAVEAAWLRGFRSFKLKVGAASVERDVERVRRVRAQLDDLAGSGIGRLRLDANGAWSEAEAWRALEQLSALDIEFIEQPLAANQLAEASRLRSARLVPIAADEAAANEADVARLIAHGAADWIVVKPAAAGGLRAADRIVAKAREAGLGIVVTSLLDSAIGVAAALHFAVSLTDSVASSSSSSSSPPPGSPASPSSTPSRLAACGLATGSLLKRDLAELKVSGKAAMELPDGCGLGLEPLPQALALARSGPSLEICG